MLGTNAGTLADKRAAPYSLVIRKDLTAFASPHVARVQVIALRQRYCGWPGEQVVKAIYRASGVTQQTIDTHTELLVVLELFWSLQILSLRYRFLILPDDPWFNLFQLDHEVGHFDDEISNDGEVA